MHSGFAEKKGLSCSSFPKACPSNNFYDRLFNKTVELHYKVFPDECNLQHNDGNDIMENIYREKFEKSKHEFCTLNTTAVLEDEEWKQFFNGL